MKDQYSVLKDFTLSGSVNTEIYNNSYKTAKAEQELKGAGGVAIRAWYTSGGVVGWALNGTRLKFSQISLNDIWIRGTSAIGGLLGYSNNTTQTVFIIVDRCSAKNISLDLASGYNDTNNRRCGAGAFVGKIREGGVYVYGTANLTSNTDTSLYKDVVISDYKAYEHWTVNLGGLVGYAGNGCQVYDMHVKASSGANITIGNKTVGIAAGLVGLMQPQGEADTTCNAKFVNCIVQNINIAAFDYAGGLYGGTHNDGWSPYTIAVRNCQMIGNETANNTIAAYGKYEKKNDGYKGFAGGLVADGFVVSSSENSYNIEIADSKVSHYTITSSQTNTSSGGFIGYANARGSNSVVCYIHDSAVENCTLGASGKHAGGVIGEIAQNTENKMLGYNIKLDTITDGTTNGSNSNMGAWIGKVDSGDAITKIQLVGIAIYVNGFTKNVGVNALKEGNASFVFADYNEGCADANTLLSRYNYNVDTHVDMPKYPYVNVNPQSSMGTGKIISGDGAAVYDNNGIMEPMAKEIYDDLSNVSNSRRYTTFANNPIEGSNTIDKYWTRTKDDSGDRISTYFTEKSISELGTVNNFPVVVISGKNNGYTTYLINRYIQLVTNTKTDYIGSALTIEGSHHATSEFYDVVIDNAVYKDGAFEIDNEKPGLMLTTEQNNNYIALDGANADTQKDGYTFTLVDIQFKDPLGKEKIVYHLYVPVYTIKLMEIQFFSAARSGTNAVGIDNYEESFGVGIAEGVDNWITQYVRYAYEKEDIQMLLNSGSLNWNFDKSFVLVTENRDTAIPIHDGTLLTLVDPNADADSVYYAKAEDFKKRSHTYETSTKDDLVIELAKFKNGGNNFKVKTLNELIEDLIKVEVVESGLGAYTKVTDGQYDVYVGENRYKFVETGNGNINLTLKDDAVYFVNDGKYYICEDYYISQYVPSPETQTNLLYNYRINCDGTLSGEKKAIVTNPTGKQPTVLIADLYEMDKTDTDTMTVTSLGKSEQISSANNELSVTITNTITLNNEYTKPVLESKSIYHSFAITLNRYAEDGVRSDISILHKSSIKNLKCTIQEVGGKSEDIPLGENDYELNYEEGYINIITGDIMKYILDAYYGDNNKKQPIVISLSFDIEFDPTQLDPYFPSKEVNDTEHQYGINVSATSNLSYNKNKLANSSMNYHYSDGQFFFIPNENEALIFYYAVSELDEYDDYGRMSENKSTLGVNGYSEATHNLDYMPINTEAKYNTEKIRKKLSEATRVKVTIWLKKKEDTVGNNGVTNVGYSADLKLMDYIDPKVEFSSGTAKETGTLTDRNATSLEVYLPKDKCKIDGDFIILNMGFKAKTGGDFHDYANYRIYLQVELANDSSDFESTKVFTHLVYTNAKVYPSYFAE